MNKHKPDDLPLWLRTLYVAISEFPSTNGIKVEALILMVATGFALAIASAKEANVSESILSIWLTALLAMLGVGAWQSNKKWSKFRPQPPTEDVAAVHGTPEPELNGGVPTTESNDDEAVG